MNTLGDRISSLRKSKGLSQRKLMDILNFDNLSKYEKDQRQPNYEILKKIADFFNVSTDWLLTGQDSDQHNLSDEGSKVEHILGKLSDEEIHFIELLRQVDDHEKAKIEGMLELKIAEAQSAKKELSSPYQNGDEDAATDEKFA